MFFTFFVFLMKFADISKLHSQRCPRGNDCNKTACWQHVARIQQLQQQHQQHEQQQRPAYGKYINANSSSTSSGCDSNTSISTASATSSITSSKENADDQKRQQRQVITKQKLQALQHYQQLQVKHLQLLQQELLHRRRLQEQQAIPKTTATTTATLTCNQEYLKQQNSQQKNFRNFETNQNIINNNNVSYLPERNFELNNNEICNNNFNTFSPNFDGNLKGQRSRRGMTEFTTTNDIENKPHLSQPLQNSPRHQFHLPNSSPQHFYALKNHHLIHSNDQVKHHSQQQQQHFINNTNNNNNKTSQQTLPINSSANINNTNIISPITTTATTPSSLATSAHSPLHYRNPSNSPSNSPFARAYYGINQQQQNTPKFSKKSEKNKFVTTGSYGSSTPQQRQYHQLQQHLRSTSRQSFQTQTQYQQYLNDLLSQQHHLQLQQQKVLNSKQKDDSGDSSELSEESLKQNVAIVLNNLDRYSSALRSIILNEAVITNSEIFFDENLLASNSDARTHGGDFVVDSGVNSNSGNNNNFGLDTAILGYNNMAAAAATPESDYNSNATTPGSNMLLFDSNVLQQQQNVVGGVANNIFGSCGGGGGGGNNIGGVYNGGGISSMSNNLTNCSLASSHDFTHDNSDYQWFLDYGYRDGCSGMQRSVLSSLSASFNGFGDLIYYEDLARNLDANLAEADIESFRTADIHSLLSHLPSYCKSLGSENSRLQQSLLLQQQQQQRLQQQQQLQHLDQQQHMDCPLSAQQNEHNFLQTSTTSTSELIDNSICKSELLFSPVKESHISVDSLDMDAYPDDGDIILTCKANKDNYTIAFEGSVLYSDESFYEPSEFTVKNKPKFLNLHSNLDDIVKRKSLDASMSRSEQAQSQQKISTRKLQRYPSGNNNTGDEVIPIVCMPRCIVRKSNSLPNLIYGEEKNGDKITAATCPLSQLLQKQLNVSHSVSISALMDCCKSRNLLPMCQIPISSCNSNSASISEKSNEKQQQQIQRHKHRCCSSHSPATSEPSHNSSSTTTNVLQQQQQQQQQYQQRNLQISGSASSGNSTNPPAFNLVKLFIKQKSSNCSNEDVGISAHTCMDVSSGCWPSSDAAASSSNSSIEHRLRKKSMNDSGKGSALSRHEEEGDHFELRQENDSAFSPDVCNETSNGEVQPTLQKQIIRAVDGSPSRTLKMSPAQRRRSVPLRHPQLDNLTIGSDMSLPSSEGSHSNSEQMTQIHISTAYGTQKKNSQQPTTDTTSTEMITRSMQTSCGGSLSARSSLSERFRCVPPSFLAKLNTLGAERQAPIYVIYPNYALPDLGFVKTHATSTDVIFSPFNYKAIVGKDPSSGCLASLKKRFGVNSVNDELLKTMDYSHVVDWESLATLLPNEYRQRLKHIPQVSNVIRQMGVESSQRPLFCIMPKVRRSRQSVCDCGQQTIQRNQEEATSSSGSSQQPSSGYRGSSTLLTDDSQLDIATDIDPLKQMYVYQYEQQRMDAGVELSPGEKISATPQPRPRGILRKSSSLATRAKRNSMIEEQNKLTKFEKRRSLQEPYQHTVGSSEEQLYNVYEEEMYAVSQPRTERLSRKDLDARARAENFLSSIPRSELKYYAEIAALLESSEDHVQYDAAALKKEVSRVLSQQKKVSFNDNEDMKEHHQLQNANKLQIGDKRQQMFSTPPNSPIISLENGARAQSAHSVQRRLQADKQTARKFPEIEEKEQRKIESNRFKRLQIQWELMSKDSTMLKALASTQETKSGGSTPTAGPSIPKSRIPRPVSYPAGRSAMKCKSEPNICKKSKENTIYSVSPKITTRINAQDASGKATGIRSPSGIVPPKRYSTTAVPISKATPVVSTPSPTGGGPRRAITPTSTSCARTPNSRVATTTAPQTQHTPKRYVQSPRRSTPKTR